MALVHDVLIIGGGGAGLRAAIAAAEADPKLNIALVSKVYPMRSHTVSAEGGSAGVIKENDSLEEHIKDTISGADWLADQDVVELFVKTAPAELLQLEHWGCPWSREPDGHVAVRPFGGMRIERTWFAADKTGFHMLHALFQTSLKYESIQRYDEWFATKLLIENGRCQGVTAIEMRSGLMQPIFAKAVIVCTGGGGRIFPFTTNGAIKTGDGWLFRIAPEWRSKIWSLSNITRPVSPAGYSDHRGGTWEKVVFCSTRTAIGIYKITRSESRLISTTRVTRSYGRWNSGRATNSRSVS